MRLKLPAILALIALVVVPLSPAYGLGPLPENGKIVPASGGIFGSYKAVNDSAADAVLKGAWVAGLTLVPGGPIIRLVAPVAMEVIGSISPQFRVFTDDIKNSTRETVSTAITPVIEGGFQAVPEEISARMWDARQKAENENGRGWAWGLPAQTVASDDNPGTFPYTYRYAQQGPVEQSGEQDNNAGILLRPSAGIQQVPVSQETSWRSFDFRNNDSGYSGAAQPAVEPQVEQPAVTPWTTFSAFNNSPTNQSLFSELTADDYGPYNWASQFYSLSFDSGQTRQSDEWPGFDADGSSYDWSL